LGALVERRCIEQVRVERRALALRMAAMARRIGALWRLEWMEET